MGDLSRARQAGAPPLSVLLAALAGPHAQVLGSERSSASYCLPSLTGYIRNTEKLSYGKEQQYKLSVTAYDCGKKRAAEDVLVKISIKPTCTPGWQGEPPPLPLEHLPAN